MADQEVVKHTKKIYKIWESKDHTFLYKLREFIVEILIIVFAVSLSIWLHSRSEHVHEQEEVKEFLLGLKEDLQSDILEMTNDKRSYILQRNAFKYISSIKLNEHLNIDSLQKYLNPILSETNFVQNNGRFEGFKSSGKVGSIENKKLQGEIMDLYQEDIPSLLASTENYIQRKRKLIDFGISSNKRFSEISNLVPIFESTNIYNMCGILANTGQIEERYIKCIAKMKEIITEIDSIYTK